MKTKLTKELNFFEYQMNMEEIQLVVVFLKHDEDGLNEKC